MKKSAFTLVVCAGLFCSMGALLTQDQAIATGALEALKLKFVPAEGGRIGGPMEYQVTDDTIEYLQQLQKDGKKIVVENSGEVKIQ